MQRAVATKVSSFAIAGLATGLFAVAIQRHTLAFEGIFAGIPVDKMVTRILLPAITFLVVLQAATLFYASLGSKRGLFILCLAHWGLWPQVHCCAR